MVEITVEWVDFAKAKLREIADYYIAVAGERTARTITGKIVAKTRRLARNPLSGQRELALEDQPHIYRRLVAGNYKIIYRVVIKTTEIVEIDDIFDCRQDPTAMFDALHESTAEPATTKQPTTL